MSTAAQEAAGSRWLIVGHGSVGSALARRLTRAGIRPGIFDPAPRLAVADGELLPSLAGLAPFDRIISCVMPSAAMKAVAAVAPGAVVDVALMDTLDQEAAHPTLAVSGPQAPRAATLLRSLGFLVDEVGAECGDAALLKLGRSLFMKCLEALVIEFRAAVAPLAGRDAVLGSIERNLGPAFTAFSRMLIETDRVHAERRAAELGEAVAIFAASGRSLDVAGASVAVLYAAAAAWRLPDAPPASAGADALAGFLTDALGKATHAPR